MENKEIILLNLIFIFIFIFSRKILLHILPKTNLIGNSKRGFDLLKQNGYLV